MRRWVIHIVLIVSAASLVYFNTLQNSFHLDDFYRVVDNPEIQKLSPVWRHFVDPGTMSTLERITQYRPLLPLTLSLNYSIAENSLVGYHLGNLFFQIVASILVYFLCMQLLRYSSWRFEKDKRHFLALFVALLFAIHPVSGILVNYICARDLILMQVFLMASFLAYIRMRLAGSWAMTHNPSTLRKGFSPLGWITVLVLLAFSLLSKANAVVAPALVFLFEVTLEKERILSKEPWIRMLPFAAIILSYFLFTKLYLGSAGFSVVVSDGGTSTWGYALTQAKLHLFHYLRNFLWPFLIRQAPFVEPSNSFSDYRVLLGFVFIAASLVLAWRLWKTYPVLSFCILAYWILMIPASSFLPFHHLAVDYRPYASSPFLFLFVSLVIYKFVKPGYVVPVFLILIGYFAFSSIHLNKTWRTEETLWTHSVKHGGDSLAHLNLAMSLSDRNDPRVREHLEEALRLSPYYILAHMNLGLLLIDLGEGAEGLQHCQKAVELNPSRAQSHFWLSRAYSKLGRIQEAAEASAKAAQLNQRNLKYQYRAALDAQQLGHYLESLKYVQVIEKSQPDYEETLFLKGFALQMTGELRVAIDTYKTFLTWYPDHTQAQFNLGHALMTTGNYGEAIQHFDRTLLLKSDYLEVHLHLATCYEELGNSEEALKHLQIYRAGNH